MKKVLNIIGARPQIIKAAAISRCLNRYYKGKIEEIIVHSGQHFDDNLSEVFFSEMGIPKPKYFLNEARVSSTQGKQTGEMLIKLEEVFVNEKPDAIIIYGDTNTTLAAAIAASKIDIPVIHIEAGLRSFKKQMPEEINRIVADHVSTLLFCPTTTSVENLKNEGFLVENILIPSMDQPAVFHCGDIMLDNALHFSAKINKTNLEKYGVNPGNFILATIHRNLNTDDPVKLSGILEALCDIAEKHNVKVILPLHPRTKAAISKFETNASARIAASKLISTIEPVSYLEMILLESSAKLIITDSGGVQKEAFFFKKPCVILRDETEWTEIVSSGSAVLAGSDGKRIIKAYETLSDNNSLEFPEFYGNGTAAEFICEKLFNFLTATSE